MKQSISNAKKAKADAKTVTIKARFTASDAVLIDAAWKVQGFTNRSAFLRHAALTVAGEDSQSPAMLEAMRSHRKELGAVGRNINQLAYEMNRRNKAGMPIDPGLLVKVEDLDGVRNVLKGTAHTLNSILKKSPKREGRKRG